jgi:hypothetical protein
MCGLICNSSAVEQAARRSQAPAPPRVARVRTSPRTVRCRAFPLGPARWGLLAPRLSVGHRLAARRDERRREEVGAGAVCRETHRLVVLRGIECCRLRHARLSGAHVDARSCAWGAGGLHARRAMRVAAGSAPRGLRTHWASTAGVLRQRSRSGGVRLPAARRAWASAVRATQREYRSTGWQRRHDSVRSAPRQRRRRAAGAPAWGAAGCARVARCPHLLICVHCCWRFCVCGQVRGCTADDATGAARSPRVRPTPTQTRSPAKRHALGDVRKKHACLPTSVTAVLHRVDAGG